MAGVKRVKRPMNVRQGYKRQHEERSRDDSHPSRDQPREPDRKQHKKEWIDPDRGAFDGVIHRLASQQVPHIPECHEHPGHGLAPMNLPAVGDIVGVGVPDPPLARLHHLTGVGDPSVRVVIKKDALVAILGQRRRPFGLERLVRCLDCSIPLIGAAKHQHRDHCACEDIHQPRPLQESEG